MKKIALVIVSLILTIGFIGCVPLAIGYAGYAISSSNDKAAQKETDAKNLQTYETYKADAEKLNLERAKANLKFQPVMTFAEWKLAHNIPTPAPEPNLAKSN